VEFYLNDYTRSMEVMGALRRMSYGGDQANLAAGLQLLRSQVFTATHGARLYDLGVARLAVIFTESRPTTLAATLAEAAATRRAGIGIVTVGIGSAVDLYDLSAVASYPHERTTFHAHRLGNLSDVSDPIKRIICRGTYLLIDLRA